jgi:COMPASS component SWD2
VLLGAGVMAVALHTGGVPTAVKLSDDLVSNLAVGKVYRDHKGPITGLDFTYDGLHVVTAGEDNGVYVYDAQKAQRSRHLRCEKYGVSLLRFLHNDKDCVIAASRNPTDHVLKYWDFHDNKYLRLFRSHTARVTSVCPHPYEDIFLSGSEDQSMMLWDIRQDRPAAKVTGQGPTLATFDQQGLVFAACVGQPKLHLFDTKNYSKGEFTSFDLSTHLQQDPLIRHVQFSPCGKYLLVNTAKQLILVDAYDGELICEYPIATSGRDGAVESGALVAEPGFSPDSQYVLCGVPGGDVCIWATTNARPVHRLQGHTKLPGRVAFSPVHALVVTAAETLAWWIPDSKHDPGS